MNNDMEGVKSRRTEEAREACVNERSIATVLLLLSI